MTRYLLDVASYQGSLRPDDCARAGFTAVNLKVSHGLGVKAVHPDAAAWVEYARAHRWVVSSFHFLTAEGSGAAQAKHAYAQMQKLGLVHAAMHQADCEADASLPVLRDYIITMQALLGRKVSVYSGRWWWGPKGWNVSDLTPHFWSSPAAGYLAGYPGDTSPHWAGYGGWDKLAIMQYTVGPLVYPDGTKGTIDVSKSAIRDPAVAALLSGGGSAAMNAPVCTTADLEQYTGETLADPWLARGDGTWWDIPVPVLEDQITAHENALRVALPRAWVVVPAQQAFLAELNKVAPARDKASDGAIGDYAHQTGSSGHNPDDTSGSNPEDTDADTIAEVRARDYDSDLKQPGLTMERIAQYLVTECRAGRIKWIKYIIFNKRIWSASGGWVTKAYTGANPHDKHMHVSCKPDTASENTVKPVGLATLLEDTVPFKDEKIPLTALAGKDLYEPDRAEGTEVAAHHILQTAAIYGQRASANTAAILKAQTGMLATLAELKTAAAADAARDAAAVAALTAAVTEVQAIRTLLERAGGDPDLVPVMERLDALPDLIRTSGAQAGEAAAATVLGRLADAQEAEAAALRAE